MEFLKKLIQPFTSLREIMGFIYLYMETRGEFDYNNLIEIYSRHFATNLRIELIRSVVAKFDYLSNNSFSNFVITYRELKSEISRIKIIIPPCDQCLKCSSKLVNVGNKTILTFYCDGSKFANYISLECKQCQIIYNAYNFEKKTSNTAFKYKSNITTNIIKISSQTCFDTKLLNYLDESICRNGMKFDGFCEVYNRCFNQQSNSSNRILYRKRLSEAYFSFKITQFLIDINAPNDIPDFKSKQTETFLETKFDIIENHFINKWTTIHRIECKSLNCHETGKNSICVNLNLTGVIT